MERLAGWAALQRRIGSAVVLLLWGLAVACGEDRDRGYSVGSASPTGGHQGSGSGGVGNAPKPTWDLAFGDTGEDLAEGVATHATDVLVAGTFAGSVTVDDTTLQSAGGTDAFAVRLDAFGSRLWSVAVGGSAAERAVDVKGTAGGDAVVLGTFSGLFTQGGATFASQGGDDVMLLRLDPAGALIGSTTFGGPDAEEAFRVVVDGSGGAFVAGSFTGLMAVGGDTVVTTSGGPDRDLFLARVGGDGLVDWTLALGDDSSDEGSRAVLTLDESGDVVIAGTFDGSINLGVEEHKSQGLRDIFVGRLSPGGLPLFSAQLGGEKDDEVGAVVSDAAGRVVVVGDFEGTLAAGGETLTASDRDVFVAALDDTGNVIWVKRFPGEADQRGTAAAVLAPGKVAIAGSLSGTMELGSVKLSNVANETMFLAALDTSDGSVLWAQGFGEGVITPRAMAVDTQGALLVAGSFESNVLFSVERSSAGGADAFLVKLAP